MWLFLSASLASHEDLAHWLRSTSSLSEPNLILKGSEFGEAKTLNSSQPVTISLFMSLCASLTWLWSSLSRAGALVYWNITWTQLAVYFHILNTCFGRYIRFHATLHNRSLSLLSSTQYIIVGGWGEVSRALRLSCRRIINISSWTSLLNTQRSKYSKSTVINRLRQMFLACSSLSIHIVLRKLVRLAVSLSALGQIRIRVKSSRSCFYKMILQLTQQPQRPFKN